MPVHEALLAEIYQVQSAIGQMTGKPEVMPKMDSQRCWPEVGFVEVKSLFTLYPREHRSPVQSYGL